MRIPVAIILFCVTSMYAFANDNPAQNVKTYFVEQTEIFLNDLRSLSKKEKAGISENKLREPFLKARLSFKRVEFLLMYSNNQEAKNINGANLVVNNYNKRAPNEEIQPHGLQVIEALIYEPEIGSRSILQAEINQLIFLIEKILERYQTSQDFDEVQLNKIIWDALRYEVYRIEALGICGFDVPICLNALPETHSSLESFKQVLLIYKPILDELDEKNLFTKGNELLTNAQNYLKKNSDFNAFDRYAFIVSYLHPLSDWISKVQNETGFKIKNLSRPVDNEAVTLFDQNIFNSFYFPDKLDTLKIKLGQELFHDPVFSADQSRSCATCHMPEIAYSDGVKKNTAIGTTDLLRRNTPSLFNVGFQSRFFYDTRVNSLEKQILDVIHNALEMNGNFSDAVKLISADSVYQKKFSRVYRQGITESNVLNALAGFVKSLISFNSKFDKNIRAEASTLTAEEKNGFNLFAGKGKCATCHFMPLFNGLVPPFYEETESEILGVPFDANQPKIIDTDAGKFEFTGLELHRNSFKTQGIRNINLTAPYMHNGVFNTLEEVMNFYNLGGGVGQGMEIPDQTLSSENLQLTEEEIASIIAFLKALEDTTPLY